MSATYKRVHLRHETNAAEVVAMRDADGQLCVAIHTGACMVHLRPSQDEMRELVAALREALGEAA